MTAPTMLGVGAITLVLTLGCSAGDLTLPRQPEPAALVIVSGDRQRAEAGTFLEEPLRVQVLDGSSRPVSRTPVKFTFVGDLAGAGLDPTSLLTDEGGFAEAVVRLGNVTGQQLIEARVADTEDADLSARFRATAVPPENDGSGEKGDGGSDDDEDD